MACHQFSFLERLDVLKGAEPGADVPAEQPLRPGRSLGSAAAPVQQQIIDKKLKFYVIDGYEVAKETGMGGRINTIMQTCFFAISGVLPRDEAIDAIKHAIEKTYGKRGESGGAEELRRGGCRPRPSASKSRFPARSPAPFDIRPPVPASAPEFVQRCHRAHDRRRRRRPAVSAMPIDGTFPTGTAQWEKRNIALEIPVWDEELCIQCGKCVLVCPHAVIRAKVYDASDLLAGAPATFKSAPARWKDFKEHASTPCRSRPKIAPAARCAWRSARPRTRAK